MSTADSAHVDPGQQSSGPIPAPTEEAIEQAKKDMGEMDQRYEPGARKSVTVPGTDGTISGTAFAEHVAEMSDEKVEELDKRFADFQTEQAKQAKQAKQADS